MIRHYVILRIITNSSDSKYFYVTLLRFTYLHVEIRTGRVSFWSSAGEACGPWFPGFLRECRTFEPALEAGTSSICDLRHWLSHQLKGNVQVNFFCEIWTIVECEYGEHLNNSCGFATKWHLRHFNFV